MRLDWELAVRGYRRFAAYPAASGRASHRSVFGFIQAYVLLALFETRDDIGGYDATDTLTYVWLARRCSPRSASSAMRTLPSGSTRQRRPDLIRPVHPLRAGLSTDFGRALYHALFRGLPPSSSEPSSSTSRHRAIHSSGWYSRQRRARDRGDLRLPLSLQPRRLLAARLPGRDADRRRHRARSSRGFIIPIRFFPEWLQTLAYATPSRACSSSIDVFVGASTGAELVATLAMQLGWLVALLAACQ